MTNLLAPKEKPLFSSTDDLEEFPETLIGIKDSPYIERSKLTIVLGESEKISEPQKIIILSASDVGSAQHSEIGFITEYSSIAKRVGHSASVGFCTPALMNIYQQRATTQSRSADNDTMKSLLIDAFFDMLDDAIAKGASDIHIEVRRNEARVRYRIDGDLIQTDIWPTDFAERFVQAVYSVVAEEQDVTFKKDEPQAALIDKIIKTGRVRVRLATIPASPDGFDCVMRVLPFGKKSDQRAAELKTLGYSDDHVRLINMGLSKPVGVVIIAGTTGSGKSTTLKNILQAKIENSDGSLKVITIEDPPEYFINGATQVPVSRNKKSTDGSSSFVAAMRAVMRSDPDAIMVGEVRDEISADLLVGMVQSGHQVSTTVHAASAIGIVGRLSSMKVNGDVLGSVDFIGCLIYQALIPVLCPHCKELMNSTNTHDDMADRVGAVAEEGDAIYVRGKGCDKCNNGIKGRTVVAEVVMPDYTMLRFFSENKSIDAMEHWLAHGGKQVIEHGIEKMRAGILSPYDVEDSLGSLTSHLVMRDGKLEASELKYLPSTLTKKTLAQKVVAAPVLKVDVNSDMWKVDAEEKETMEAAEALVDKKKYAKEVAITNYVLDEDALLAAADHDDNPIDFAGLDDLFDDNRYKEDEPDIDDIPIPGALTQAPPVDYGDDDFVFKRLSDDDEKKPLKTKKTDTDKVFSMFDEE